MNYSLFDDPVHDTMTVHYTLLCFRNELFEKKALKINNFRLDIIGRRDMFI